MSPFCSAVTVRSVRVVNQTHLLHEEHNAVIERSRVLVRRSSLLRAELVEARGRALRLMEMSANLIGLRREQEMTASVAEAESVSAGPFVDVEMLEDRELISTLNERGFDCEKCGRDEPLVAVARFVDYSAAIGICGDCYREMKEMSRGEVV